MHVGAISDAVAYPAAYPRHSGLSQTRAAAGSVDFLHPFIFFSLPTKRGRTTFISIDSDTPTLTPTERDMSTETALTDHQIALLAGILHSDYDDFRGWDTTEDDAVCGVTWAFDAIENGPMGRIPAASVGGVLARAVEAGLITYTGGYAPGQTGDEVEAEIGITLKGYRAIMDWRRSQQTTERTA